MVRGVERRSQPVYRRLQVLTRGAEPCIILHLFSSLWFVSNAVQSARVPSMLSTLTSARAYIKRHSKPLAKKLQPKLLAAYNYKKAWWRRTTTHGQSFEVVAVFDETLAGKNRCKRPPSPTSRFCKCSLATYPHGKHNTFLSVW